MDQALATGATRTELATVVTRGTWRREMRGVLVDNAAPRTWKQEFAIGVLGTGGVASHRAAARLHELDGFDRAGPELSVRAPRQPRQVRAVVHRVKSLERRDVVVVDGIPTTSIARTLCDLGAVVDDDKVEQALDDALRRGCSLRWIEETLDRLERPGPSGTSSLRRVLQLPDRTGPLPDSLFERLVERAIRSLDLPEPQRQIEVVDESGNTVARIDIGWPAIRLGIEADSERWHSGHRRARAGRARDNRLAGLGWELIYAGWHHVKDPEPFVRDVGATYARLAQRGPGSAATA